MSLLHFFKPRELAQVYLSRRCLQNNCDLGMFIREHPDKCGPDVLSQPVTTAFKKWVREVFTPPVVTTVTTSPLAGRSSSLSSDASIDWNSILAAGQAAYERASADCVEERSQQAGMWQVAMSGSAFSEPSSLPKQDSADLMSTGSQGGISYRAG